MAADGARGKREALPDRAVGEPLRGELGDVQLLRGEPIARSRCSRSDRFAGRAQLEARTVRPASRADGIEDANAFP